MGGCGNSIRVVNISKYGPNRVAFKAGRAIISVFVVGHDTTGCFLNVRPVNNPKPYIMSLTTPRFDVITPKYLQQDWVCRATVYSGEGYRINITMRSLTNLVATMTTMGVLLEISGNTSGIVETTGVYAKPLSNGRTYFDIQYRPSLVPVKMVFWAGYWYNEPQYNYTYITTPYYQRITTFLGYKRVFRKTAYIQEASTCWVLPLTRATRINVLSRTPRWTEQNQPFTIQLEAVNDFGVRDTSYATAISLRVKNCNGGVEGTMSWRYLVPGTTTKNLVWANYATAAQVSTALQYTHATLTFTNGFVNVTLYPAFVTNANHTGGVKGCAIVFTSGVTNPLIPGIVENFEVRHTFPACTVCKPGTFSGGGNGRNTTLTLFHPGGCMPCMVGTFSAESGATSESFCEVCQSGYGFPCCDYRRDNSITYEGAINCNTQCGWGSTGKIGGGVCANPVSLIAANEGSWGNYGRIHRYCPSAICNGQPTCPGGTFYLNCPQLTTRAACLDVVNKGNCTWNTTSGACQGPTYNCMPCPPGTGRNWATYGGIGTCYACQAGGWQTEEGKSNVAHTYWTYQRMFCPGTAVTRNIWCAGPDRQECWNGTYSSTLGATSNSTCVPCPAGYYCMRLPRYYVADVNNVAACQTSACNIALTGGNYNCPTTAGCYNCPLGNSLIMGATMPIPCPPGTYNNFTGQSDISACIRCWAGTFCPKASIYPQVTDTNHTEDLLTGNTTPTAVSYYGSEGVMSCKNIANQDGSGYIEDGHFNWFPLYFRNNNGVNYFPIESYRSAWQGSFIYVDVDRFNLTTSMSIRTNSSRGSASQTMKLTHELPMPMVARAWIKYNLQNRNMSSLVAPNLYVRPFVGIELTLQYVDVLTGAQGETESFSYFAQPSPSWAWQLLELNVTPTRPIRYATMSLSTRGFYFGYALFDDIAFRPADDIICQCSTGFYYNASEPTKKCQRCKAGFACSGGTIQRCVNSYSCSASAGCLYCRDGWLCDSDGRGRHIPCNIYTYKNNITEQCFPCPIGYRCKDGVKHECNDGTYGDGGMECLTCKPGYYSPKQGPQHQCLLCPPGYTSQAGRSSCFQCPVNHYSVNGTECYSADVGYFVPAVGASNQISCTSPVMDNYTITMPRNRHGYVIRVVPRTCENHYSYEVTRSVDITNGGLGKVRLSTTSAAILYDAGAHNYPQNTHVFRVYFTSNVNAIEQYATVSVTLTNTAMVGVNDDLWVPHPMEQDTTYRITTWLSNNRNAEHDWIWVQSVTAPVATYAAAMAPVGTPRVAQWDMGANPGALVGVDYSANHPALLVTLPKGFRGPMNIRPITYDQYCSSGINADCLETSPHDIITITARTRPPVAVNDYFRIQVGQVVPLDLLANDYDPENDIMTIVSTTASTLSNRVPAIQRLCAATGYPGCGAGTGCTTNRLYPTCGCDYNIYEDRCRPVNKSQSLTFVDFAARTGSCGLETFTYTIQTNDGTSTGTVTIDNYRCYCDATHPYNGFNVIFVLDGTSSVSDFASQLAFADGVIKRSQTTSLFWYGIVEVGANKVDYALNNIQPDVMTMKRDTYGDTYPYALGQGITMAQTMYNTHVGNTWVVVISTKEGADNMNSIRTRLPNARYITISVNPSGEHFLHWGEQFTNIYYSRVVKSMLELNNNADIQEELMDLMCGAKWQN
eukprot:GILI01003687.1.p1 GENE.GILI01003687.1~~GILI01003687.1.p1  ORF type:complete len:1685 (-),score=278.80 GILI01003687.1:175-5169(-)